MKKRIVLIGPGRVGAAVARCLAQAGYGLAAIIGRNQQRAEEAASFIGSDPDIAEPRIVRTTTPSCASVSVRA